MLRKALQTKRQLIEELNRRVLGEQETTEQQEDLGDLISVTEIFKRLKERMIKWKDREFIPKTEVKSEVEKLHSIIEDNNIIIKKYCIKPRSGRIKTSNKNINWNIPISCKKLQADQQLYYSRIRTLNSGIEKIPGDDIPSKKIRTDIDSIIKIGTSLLTLAIAIIGVAAPKPVSPSPF